MMHEMTTLQAAYWVGRQHTSDSTGDAAHLYVEFAGQGIDEERLSQAVQAVFHHHEMLRIQVSAEGQWHISEQSVQHTLHVTDWRHRSAADCDRDLLAVREQKTHQKLALEQGIGAEFCLTLLPQDHCRLHVDIDMIAADAQSFRLIIEDLTAAYHAPLTRDAVPSFSDYLALYGSAQQQALMLRDRHYWQARLSEIAPAPCLPHAPAGGQKTASAASLHTQRLATQLSSTQREALEALAIQQGVSLTALSLTAFNLVLARRINQQRFRINLPGFYRPSMFAHTVGDFANLLLFSADCPPEMTMAVQCQQTHEQLMQCLEHRHYSGVSVMRDMSRREGKVQTSPVVFTSGWNIGGDLYSDKVHDTMGEMVWACSQGAHVLLDAQIVPYRSGVLINWDVRTDRIPREFYQSLFGQFIRLLERMAAEPHCLCQPYTDPGYQRSDERPLNGLQQAYLVGRSEHLPLGGVAMQDFRCYRGRVDVIRLQARLAELVAALPVLRTHIDENTLTQWVSDRATVNFEHGDYRAMSRQQALAKAQQVIDRVSHSRHDLTSSPWNIWVLSLPESDSEDDQDFSHLVLTRFDALIADGHSIAYLLARLLATKVTPLALPDAQSEHANPPIDPQARLRAQAYWQDKLSAITEPPALPWSQPLHTLYQPRYQSETITLSRKETQALFKLAAGARLFPNSVLTAMLMEILATWSQEQTLYVGLPVAPPPKAGTLDNRSSFLVLQYQQAEEDFQCRALRVQRDIAEGITHQAFSGIELNRLLLSRLPPHAIPLPVVITNGLGWEVLPEDNPVQQHDGLTQTPQIAVDFRLTFDEQKNLRIRADYVSQALSQDLVRTWLTAWKRAAISMITRQSLQWITAEALDFSHYQLNTPQTDAEVTPFLVTLAERLFYQPGSGTALICGTERWSYQQLGQNVALIMARLQARGLRSGDVVAVCLPRSVEHVMVTLSCALAGIIWVPIDASSPAERKAYLLSHCQPSLTVCEHPQNGSRTITPAELMQPPATAQPVPESAVLQLRSLSEQPAYYLYTSGTTGQPKCVVLNNRATANVLQQTLEKWRVDETDVLMSVTPFHHDMSVFDLFGSLCSGATLVIPEPHAEKDALCWNELVCRHQVTLWCSVPAILEMLIACQRPHQGHSLRLIAQGGDYIKPQTIATLRHRLPDARLFSLGGPTETTIWSIWHELTQSDVAVIPYGEPLPGNQYYIVDPRHQHCPQGVVGRIVTAGVNLSLGYLVEGRITQTDFIDLATPAGESVRAFKTGDLGYYRHDGRIIFSGRVNGYVKVRGVRISLTDIEKVLSEANPEVDVTVLDFVDPLSGDTELALFYVTPEEGAISAAQWRDQCRRCLPASHMPQRFVALSAYPLSANGKKDKRALHSLLQTPAQALSPLTAPRPCAQQSGEPTTLPDDICWQSIVDVYQQILGDEAPAMNEHSDFIQAGLLPLHLKAVAARLSETFGREVDARRLLNCKNAGQVARLLGQY